MSGLDAAAAHAWVQAFLDAAERETTALGDLDRESGDGDFGTNLTTSIRSARTALAAVAPGSAGAPFLALSKAFMGTGGTSGPLYGMWFRELGRADGGQDAYTLATVAAGVRAGLDTVCRLGGASPGDKTMVDAMAPAADALDGATELAAGLTAAAAAAREGAQGTAELIARRGRATWVGEIARGVVDPGALTVALFFESAPSDHL